jgi:hypothetical protein
MRRQVSDTLMPEFKAIRAPIGGHMFARRCSVLHKVAEKCAYGIYPPSWRGKRTGVCQPLTPVPLSPRDVCRERCFGPCDMRADRAR